MLQITVTVCANEKKVMEEARRLELEGVVIHEQTPTLTLNVPDRRNEETVIATLAKNIDRQFQKADAAIERAVADFMGKIDKMIGRWEAVAPSYIVEKTLLAMPTELAKLIDDPTLADLASPASLKLSKALADFRDSQASERYPLFFMSQSILPKDEDDREW